MHKSLKAYIFICLTGTHSYNFFLTEVKLFHIREIYHLQIECTEIASEDLLQKENKWCTIKIGMFSRKNVSSRPQNADSTFGFVWSGIHTKNLKYFRVIQSLILVIMICEIKGHSGECDSKPGATRGSIHGCQWPGLTPLLGCRHHGH